MTRIEKKTQFERWIDIWNMQHPAPDDEVQSAACFVHDVMQLAQKSANTLFLSDEESTYSEEQRKEHMVLVTVAIYDRICQRMKEEGRERRIERLEAEIGLLKEQMSELTGEEP